MRKIYYQCERGAGCTRVHAEDTHTGERKTKGGDGGFGRWEDREKRKINKDGILKEKKWTTRQTLTERSFIDID